MNITMKPDVGTNLIEPFPHLIHQSVQRSPYPAHGRHIRAVSVQRCLQRRIPELPVAATLAAYHGGWWCYCCCVVTLEVMR